MKKIASIIISAVAICVLPGYVAAKSTCCKLPEKGAQGPKGVQGPAGPQGSTGSAGAFGLGNSISLTLQNTLTVLDQTAVLFDGLNQVQGGVSYNPVTGVITVENAGFYLLKFGVTASASNLQFGIRLNGSLPLMPTTVIDSQASNMVGVSFIFEATAPMTTLELFNDSGSTATLQSSTISSITAYLLVSQIN